MPDLKEVKTDLAQTGATVKAEVAKGVSAIEAVNADARKAEQAAMARLNQEEGWIERNPGKTTLVFVALLTVIVAMIAKGCAG